jgi:hypothetical protein
MVPVDLKRVTKRTKTLSNRQVANARIARISEATGQKSRTKEAYTKSRKSEVRNTRTRGKHVTYNNLTHRELMRRLRQNRDRRVVLVIHAERSGANYKDKGPVWSHGLSQVEASDLLDPIDFQSYLHDSNITSTPDRYGLEVLDDI